MDSFERKIFNRILCCLLCLTLVTVGVFASSIVPIYGTDTSPRKVIKVGYFPFDGYHMEDGDGVKSGYGYDILQQMLKYENWQYEYVGYDENISWANAQEMLDNGTVDLLTSATKSDERLSKYSYSDIPIGTSSTAITVKAGDSRFDTSDYSSWNGVTVGMLANNSRNDSFADYAKEKDFAYKTVEYDTPDELLKALSNGDVDMIVTSNLLSMSGVRVIDKFDEKSFYVIVKKGNENLLAEVNDALEEIQQKTPSFAEDLYKKYYDPSSDGVVSFTKEEQAFIDACKANNVKFTAIVNADRKPMAYLKDDELTGLLVDFSKEIFDRTGLTIEFEECKSRGEYLEKVKNGAADIICDFTGTDSAAEGYGYVVTDSYYNSSVSMLVRKDYDGKGKVCALTKSSITNSKVLGQEGVEYVYYDTNKECRDAVFNGDADFTYSYTRTVQEEVYSDVTNSLACVTVPDLSIDFKMAVSLNDDAMLSSIISKGVNSITEKDISYLSEPYTYYDRTERSLLSIAYDNPLVLIGVLVLIFIIVLVVILMIITNKRRKEAKLLNEKLTLALEDADNANQAKTSFLSRVSHDMRTPLNGILGLTSLMKDKAENQEQYEDLQQLELSGEYLLNLVNDTLDVSRIENGKLELHPEVCDGHLVIENVIALSKPGIDAKNIKFTINKNDAPFDVFYIDVARLEQVFMNIIGNAIKFTPEGGTIEVNMKKFSDTEEGHITEFRITDSGIGMAPDFVPHLFEPFSQADSSKKNSFTGTGLGMTITKQIITLMGGTIGVESELGKGTTVTFTVPVVIATEEQIKLWEKSRAAENTDISLRDKHILLCEDHPLNAAIATRILETKGIIVDCAENGQLGVDKFASSDAGYYDAILMDIRMPVMDGLEASKAIRAMDRLDSNSIPIIAMTANAFDDDVKQCYDAGMNAHLGKPIENKKLFDTLKEQLGKT